MLLAVSLLSALVVGLIGYSSGRESLRKAAFDQLTTVRELRVSALEDTMANVSKGVVLDSRNLSAQTASRLLNEGFENLQSRSLTTAQEAELQKYYAETFVPQLVTATGQSYGPAAFMPTSNAGRWLQYHYTAQFTDFDKALDVDDANDGGTPFSKAAQQYGDYLSRLVKQVGYEDVLFLNLKGDVVYSAYKGVDLGSNVTTGPYRDTMLATAYRDVLATNSVSAVRTTDFERYIPSLNVPTTWVLSPIGNDRGVVGVMAAQVSLDTINNVMTGNQQWQQQGLGRTGEVYVAGEDFLMRSTSRELVENPEQYRADVIAAGTAPEIADRAVAVKGSVLIQPVRAASVEAALRGQSGTWIATGYLGRENLTAYGPVDINGLHWVAVARIDTEEAFAPVTEFTRNLVLSTLGIMLGVSVLSLLLAQVFTRPIQRLSAAVRRVGAGDLDVDVPSGSRDEIGDLGAAFNDMASGLRVKQALIDEQQGENRRLLHNLMPQSLAERYQRGETAIAEHHDNVSVVYAELVGFDEYARNLTDAAEVERLNVLMRGFDEAAQKAGIEKVRTLRGGYLASSGLSVPRVDNVRRAVDFAQQMQAVVERFRDQNHATIGLRVGVDTGTVTSGLVARTNLAYDLWGDAVNLAYRARTVSVEPGIYVSQSVRDRLQDTVTFSDAGTVELRGAKQNVWKVGP